VPTTRSPILLRLRRECRSVLSTTHKDRRAPIFGRTLTRFGTEEDPILVECKSGIDAAATDVAGAENFDTDDDLAILDSAECVTPPYHGAQL
jgi:hypothetical protein